MKQITKHTNELLHIASLEKWIPNCVDNIDDLHGIFEIEFIDEEISQIIALSTYTIAFTDNLLIITFQKYDFLTEQTKQRRILSEEKIKKAFNHKQTIKLYVGAVSLGSLANFNENGIYICVCKKQKLIKFVSHKALVKAVKEDQKKYLKPVVKGRKEGYPIDWEGQKLTSEYFVPGKEIANFK